MNKLIILIATLLLLTPAVASANLLSDPGFEGSGLGPWATDGTVGTVNPDDTSPVRSAPESLEMSIPAGGYHARVVRQDVSVTGGQPWYVEVYGKVTDAFGFGDAFLETYFLDSGGINVGNVKSSSLMGTGDWTKLSVSGTVPSDAITAQYRLVVQNWGPAADAGSVNFDDAYAIPEPTSLLLLGSGLVGLLALNRRKR